ncbi:MAG: DMT family transporter [Hyphomicrobiales bacterium]|nr:DMT family transporter [Hyphomicrobiales bacterium]
MPDAATERAQRLTGIALMCGAVACFALLDTTAKYLNLYMSTLQVVWARYTGAFLIPFAVSNPWTRPGLTRTAQPALQIGRSIMLLVSTLCNFLALRYLQLDEAISLAFSMPFFVAALSGPILGEWVRWRRWTAIAVGFVGVIIIARPGPDTFQPAALLSLGAALCYALYAIVTRILARTDSNETTLFYSNLVGAVVLIPVVPLVWVTPTDPLVIMLMVASGAFGSLGHYFLIAAHRLAPAAALASFVYSEIVWAIALGYLVFGNWPHRWTLVGCAIIVASGLYMLHRERKLRGDM